MLCSVKFKHTVCVYTYDLDKDQTAFDDHLMKYQVIPNGSHSFFATVSISLL